MLTDVAWDVQKPHGGKDTYAEVNEWRKIFRRIKRRSQAINGQMQKSTLKPFEHCRWNMNKVPKPVCVVCYRERFAAAGPRKE